MAIDPRNSGTDAGERVRLLAELADHGLGHRRPTTRWPTGSIGSASNHWPTAASWITPGQVLTRVGELTQLLGRNGLWHWAQHSDLDGMQTQFSNMTWDFATDDNLIDVAVARAALPVMLGQVDWEMPTFMRDTVASLYARIGEYDEAVWWQAQCVHEASDLATGDDDDFQTRLVLYQAGQPLEVEATGPTTSSERTWPEGGKRNAPRSAARWSGPYQSWHRNGALRAGLPAGR